jgi:hypothetical protein
VEQKKVEGRTIERELTTGPGRERKLAESVTRILASVRWAVLVVVLAVWAVVGVVFWIPLVLRALMRFLVSLLEAMFENQRPLEAARVLRNAVDFYRRGFVTAVELVTGEDLEGGREGPMLRNRLLLEFLWALAVWYFVFFFFGWIKASPIDLIGWFFSIPWGEHFRDLFALIGF